MHSKIVCGNGCDLQLEENNCAHGFRWIFFFNLRGIAEGLVTQDAAMFDHINK